MPVRSTTSHASRTHRSRRPTSTATAAPTTSTTPAAATFDRTKRARVDDRSTPTADRRTGVALAGGVTLDRGVLRVDGFDVVTRARLRRSGALLLLRAASRVWTTTTVEKLSAQQRQ